MTPFDSLTHEELIGLDDAAIEFYIDRSCAEEGVPLLAPSAPIAPVIAQIDKRVTHYIVQGMRFTNEAEARSVQAAIAATKTRRTMAHIGGSYRWQDPTHDVPADDEPSVSIEQVFDAQGAAEQKAESDRMADRKEAYDTAKKEYDKALSGRDNVARNIRSTVSAAWSLQRKRDRLTSEYDRYLPLANGDELIAKRFLQRAHSDARDVLPGLFPEGWDDEPARPMVAESVSEVPF